jgi:hypothetical protein
MRAPTALPDREESVYPLPLAVVSRALLHRIRRRRVTQHIANLVVFALPRSQVVKAAHLNLLDAGPVGAEGEPGGAVGVLGRVPEDEGVDQVVARVLGQPDAAVVFPGAGADAGVGDGGCDADFRVLGADVADGVVAVPDAFPREDGGGLVVLALWL